MSESKALSPLNEEDYGAIADAVMETARGRWFLSEFAKRNRNADTDMLLTAIKRLEGSVGGEQAHPQIERVRFDLVEMAKTIAQLKIEVASGDDQSQFVQATEALDAVVKTTETATSSILESAEQIQEMAWTLREGGADIAVCDVLDRRAADIYTACAFQDLTAQRTQKVVRTLRFLEGRINALVDAWSSDKPMSSSYLRNEADGAAQSHAIDSDQAEDAYLNVLSQDDIDVVIINHDDTPAEDWLDDYGEHSKFSVHAADDAALDDTDVAFVEVMPPVDAEIPGHQVEASKASYHSLTEIDAMPTTAKLSLFG
jgi:chemotaxis regulatin CheY-phosphate phosphatase CheZ